MLRKVIKWLVTVMLAAEGVVAGEIVTCILIALDPKLLRISDSLLILNTGFFSAYLACRDTPMSRIGPYFVFSFAVMSCVVSIGRYGWTFLGAMNTAGYLMTIAACVCFVVFGKRIIRTIRKKWEKMASGGEGDA